MSKTYKDQKAYRARVKKMLEKGMVNDPDGKMVEGGKGATSKTDQMVMAGARKKNPSRKNRHHVKGK